LYERTAYPIPFPIITSGDQKMRRGAMLRFFFLFLATLVAIYNEQVALLAYQQSQLSLETLMAYTLSRQLSMDSSSQYELAKYESFGFFDDVDNVTWQRHKKQAQKESLYFLPKQPNFRWTDRAWWLLFNVDPIFTCPNLRRVGGRGDGPKWTCDPHRLVQYSDCLIYSVGSFGVYKFEDGIISILKENSGTRTGDEEEWYPNCEIHVFDPDPKFEREGDAEKNNIHYHPWGLKTSESTFRRGGFPEHFEFLTFQEIQQRLGHENRRVDILKIDCEGCEYTTYKDWLHPNVYIRQVLVETHVPPAEPSQFFDRFLDVGFVPFSKEANSHPNAKPHGNYFEWGFVRLHPDFLNRTSSLLRDERRHRASDLMELIRSHYHEIYKQQ
jgi:Methyltransferase domain